MRTIATALIFLLLACASVSAQSHNHVHLPAIPIGEDAYRFWNDWYMQRIGVRTYMRSTYDRAGGNESADASHFLYMQGEDKNVSIDIAGKGMVCFIRTNHWHGSPWHYIVDGKDNIVSETATADPDHAKKLLTSTSFIPAKAFSQPLAWTWSATKGADLVWTPISFERSFQMAYGRTHYGTGYYIYQLYANPEQLSTPIHSWNIDRAPAKDVVDLLNRSGEDIAPLHIKKVGGTVKLDKDQVLLADIRDSSSVIRAFKLSLPSDRAIDLERMRLQVWWDGASQPSIDAPLCLFFGAGTLYNRDGREFLVKGFPLNIHTSGGRVELGCYYPMPFFKAARFTLSGIQPGDAGVDFEIRYEPNRLAARYCAYFHATYVDVPHPEPGKDLLLLDTRGEEGRSLWSGSFTGMSFVFSHTGALNTLEGDPRFFFDDSQTPQAYGTGTEEWAGGGDYWGGENMTLPLAGHPVGAPSRNDAKNEKDLIESGYRFLLADLMPFGNRAVIRLEHGGENLSPEHYEAVTYWYGLPSASLVKTDAIDIGNLSSEQAHRYYSPQASAVDTIFSRYEWGIDSFPFRVWGMDTAKMPGYSGMAGKEIYPAQEQDGRHTKGSSEFVIALDPNNLGALLRRTLDYSFPNQRAEVYIADIDQRDSGRPRVGTSGPAGKRASAGKRTSTSKWQKGDSKWQLAGEWYLAGANTCVYSDPKGELDKRLYKIRTSDRRLRDDEFLIPARLVKGRTRVKVRIVFVPQDTPLYPGHPFPGENAWSELKYEVYSYVLP